MLPQGQGLWDSGPSGLNSPKGRKGLSSLDSQKGLRGLKGLR